jgi:hypothetical protein
LKKGRSAGHPNQRVALSHQGAARIDDRKRRSCRLRPTDAAVRRSTSSAAANVNALSCLGPWTVLENLAAQWGVNP